MVAEVFAELAVVGVNRDQTRIDGVHQNTTLAGIACRQANCRYRRRARFARLSQRFGGVKVGQAAAARPDFRFRVDFAFPNLLAAVRFYRNHVVVRRTEIERVANLQRRLLIFRPVAGRADRRIASVEGPGYFEIFYVIARDLIDSGKTVAARRAAIVIPVLLRFALIDRDQRQRFAGEGHGGMRLEHLHQRADHADGDHR